MYGLQEVIGYRTLMGCDKIPLLCIKDLSHPEGVLYPISAC